MAGKSWATSDATRRSMQANRSRDTTPELLIRRELHRRGLRYRVAAAPLKGVRRTADIVFPKAHIAIMVDGCFWHGCPEHHRAPRANSDYWTAKVDRNRRRDAETTELLTAADWTVLRFWEHEDTLAVADVIQAAVEQARAAGR
jgi:DNA mismatch endonuclease (patch repair protein)